MHHITIKHQVTQQLMVDITGPETTVEYQIENVIRKNRLRYN